jgi:ribosome-associated heat shock protein Hsp15
MTTQVRIDKWLWAVRLFKTRSLATEACKKGRVVVNRTPVKPSYVLQTGKVIQVKKPPLTYTYKVLGLIQKRVGAGSVHSFIEDLTPKEALEVLNIQKTTNWFQRDKGRGRPTKKERRELDQLRNPEKKL